MGKIRPELKKSEYKLTKHAFYTAYHYALQYPEWKEEYAKLTGITAKKADGMPKGSGSGNPTEQKGLKMAELSEKKRIVEESVMEADQEMFEWLLEGVTDEQTSFRYLQMNKRMPFDKRRYYESRRKFYFILSKKLNL